MKPASDILLTAVATLVLAVVNLFFLFWYGVILLVLICLGVGIGKVAIDTLFGG